MSKFNKQVSSNQGKQPDANAHQSQAPQQQSNKDQNKQPDANHANSLQLQQKKVEER